MIDFFRPLLLWLILPLVALLIWLARKPQPAFFFPQLELLTGLPRGRARWFDPLFWALTGLGLVLCIVACAGPRSPDLSTRLPTQGVALAIVVDVSGSMNTPDFKWDSSTSPLSRLSAAKRTFRAFVEGGTLVGDETFQGRPMDPIALVTFAAVPDTVCPLTLNHTALLRTLDSLKPKEGIDAGTNIGDALAEGLVRLEPVKYKRRAMVLLSDGEHNLIKDGPDAPLTPRQAAQLAANLSIPVYTIDCGLDPNATTTDEERSNRLAGRATLADVAKLTGGQSFIASDGPALKKALVEIDRLERIPQEAVVYRKYHDHSLVFMSIALACLYAAKLMQLKQDRFK